jgi:hypothetical protein
VPRLLIAAFSVLLLLVGGSSPSLASAQGCIADAHAYTQAWESRSVNCVSPDLMGTVHSRGAKRPYPTGFWKAWAVNHSGLENFLRLNAREDLDRGQVSMGVLTMVGFPGLETWDTPVQLAVYELPKGTEVDVPTLATWFQLLQAQWPKRARFPEGAQRDLIRAYSTLTSDAVQAFEDVTGCSRADLLAGADLGRNIGCSQSFLATMKALGPSPYGAGTTRDCIRNFATRYAGDRDAASLRAVLYQCQDAGFLFTGVGWTYNTYANPMQCGSAQDQGVLLRYTEREYVIPNWPFMTMRQVANIDLPLSPTGERDFLTDGYCRW